MFLEEILMTNKTTDSGQQIRIDVPMSAYGLALLSAFSFALGTVLQQRGTLQTSAKEGDPRFLAEIIRMPVWLAGGSLQVCGWVLQAIALGRGSFVVVQSLCALSLVFALPLGVRITGQRVGRRSILGACMTLIGIVILVTAGQPQAGTTLPGTAALILSALAGFALQQSALKTGFLAPAMAASNTATLMMSVLLGLTLFQESISRDQGSLVPALIGLTLAALGVILLASPDFGPQ
jgi:drug/metabolite transporter (DMT)-like permease